MVLALLLSVAAASTALALPQGSNSQPVHVWLQAASRLVPGALVHTFVQISTPGDLIVLHRRTDGGIDVLFPTNPAQDPFTPAGTYEIVSGARGAAFAAGGVGQGMVVAALAPGPMRFVEFAARSNAWDAEAFSTAAAGPDPESQFTDAVQRMVGDGSFNYDVASYEVVPPVYAYQDTTGAYADTGQSLGACMGCSAEVWDGWVVAPALGDGSPGRGLLGDRRLRARGCEGASCQGVRGAALAVYRGGRADWVPAQPGSRGVPPSSPLTGRRSAGRSPGPGSGLVALTGGVSSAQPPSGVRTGHLRELPPIVIVQPRSRAASSLAVAQGIASAPIFRGALSARPPARAGVAFNRMMGPGPVAAPLERWAPRAELANRARLPTSRATEFERATSRPVARASSMGRR